MTADPRRLVGRGPDPASELRGLRVRRLRGDRLGLVCDLGLGLPLRLEDRHRHHDGGQDEPGPDRECQVVPARQRGSRGLSVDGQPALGFYAWDAQEDAYLPFALNVLTLRGGQISDVTAFVAQATQLPERDVYER